MEKKISESYQPTVCALAPESREYTSKAIFHCLRESRIADVAASTVSRTMKAKKIGRTTAIKAVLVKRNKQIRLNWCETMRIRLMVKP